ncbi:MAG: synthase, subunit b [Planctomycetota bacterium]|nr:synthase, subunit b [Planctomycetota bacterium]
MTRPSILSLGLLALALAVLPARLARADEGKPQTKSGSAREEAAAPHDIAGVIADEAHGKTPHDAAGHAEPNILEFKPSLMVSTVIVFLVLLAVLWKFAWGPLSEALAERERKQEETLQHAEEARSESARLLAEHKKQMDTAAEQVRQMLEEARRHADELAQRIALEAQAAAEETRERAEREIGTAKNQALSEIWSKTADLAVSVASKVLSKEMSHDDHRRLVDAAVGELPAGANGHGGYRV